MNNSSWKTTFLFISVILLIFTWATYTSNLTLLQQRQRLEHVSQMGSELIVPSALNTSRCASGDCAAQLEFVARRLQAAETNWIRASERRREAVSQVQLRDGVDSNQARIVWDFFYPSFDCPFTKERIGRVGDGGKWVCGFGELLSKSPCVVLSFGVSGDTSFEDEILRRTQNCAVHMFDPTISWAPAIVGQYPGRAFFQSVGIGSENGGNLKTLKSIMAELEVESLDILKMDVEGAEWESMRRILEDFPGGLPFAQLQIEVHLNNFGTSDWLQILNNWWQKLESAGLRPFFREPNLLNAMRYEFRELAFLNVNLEPFRL